MNKPIHAALFFLLACYLCKLVTCADQRCHLAPNWRVKGRNPIFENVAKGNVVVVAFVSSRSKRFLRLTLDALNNYGQYYTYVIRQKVKIMVINLQEKKLPRTVNEYFQNIEIYNIPDSKGYFKGMEARCWDVFVYDTCGRMQFRYSYPYTFPGFPFLSQAINYANRYYKVICGKCIPIGSLNLASRELLINTGTFYPAETVVTVAKVNNLNNQSFAGEIEKISAKRGISEHVLSKDRTSLNRKLSTQTSEDEPNEVRETNDRTSDNSVDTTQSSSDNAVSFRAHSNPIVVQRPNKEENKGKSKSEVNAKKGKKESDEAAGRHSTKSNERSHVNSAESKSRKNDENTTKTKLREYQRKKIPNAQGNHDGKRVVVPTFSQKSATTLQSAQKLESTLQSIKKEKLPQHQTKKIPNAQGNRDGKRVVSPTTLQKLATTLQNAQKLESTLQSIKKEKLPQYQTKKIPNAQDNHDGKRVVSPTTLQRLATTLQNAQKLENTLQSIKKEKLPQYQTTKILNAQDNHDGKRVVSPTTLQKLATTLQNTQKLENTLQSIKKEKLPQYQTTKIPNAQDNHDGKRVVSPTTLQKLATTLQSAQILESTLQSIKKEKLPQYQTRKIPNAQSNRDGKRVVSPTTLQKVATALPSTQKIPTTLQSVHKLSTVLLSNTKARLGKQQTRKVPNAQGKHAIFPSSQKLTTKLQSTQKLTTTMQSTQKPITTMQSTRKPTTTMQSTQKPTTAMQSTQKITTAMQSTQKPTTAMQSTQKLTTAMQSTQKPTTAMQSTQKPTTTMQSTHKSTTTMQSTQKPTTAMQSTQKLTTAMQSTQGKLPTTEKSVLDKESGTIMADESSEDLDREIAEENAKLYKQIEVVETLTRSKTESNNDFASSFNLSPSLNRLVHDYLLHKHIPRKKKLSK